MKDEEYKSVPRENGTSAYFHSLRINDFMTNNQYPEYPGVVLEYIYPKR